MKIMNWNFGLIMDDIDSMEAAIEFIKGYVALVNKDAETMFIVDTKTGEIRKVQNIRGKLKVTSRE